LLFQSPQGYEFQHRFANGDKINLNDIDYQVNGNQLIAIGARGGVTDGDQLIRYHNLKRGVGVRFSTPLNESKLSLDNDTLSINRLTRRHLPERTLILVSRLFGSKRCNTVYTIIVNRVTCLMYIWL
jgi:hypothetical protein